MAIEYRTGTMHFVIRKSSSKSISKLRSDDSRRASLLIYIYFFDLCVDKLQLTSLTWEFLKKTQELVLVRQDNFKRAEAVR